MPGIDRTRISAVVTMAVLLMGAGALGRDAPDRLCTQTGQWWQYRGDQRLSGRTLLKGRIDRPVIEWAHPIAGRETLLAVRMMPGPVGVSLPTADKAAVPGREAALANG